MKNQVLSPMKSLKPMLLVAALGAAMCLEAFAANISLNLSNRRVEANAEFNSDVEFSSALGLFNENVSAASGGSSGLASQDSDLSLIGDVLSANGVGTASADGPQGSADSNLFLEFTLASSAPFQINAATSNTGVSAGGSVILQNLTDSVLLFQVFNGGSQLLSGTLLAGKVYQLSAVASASGGGGDTGTWDLGFVVGSTGVPDGGATVLLMGLAGVCLSVLRRQK
jgi:hypothetical protein